MLDLPKERTTKLEVPVTHHREKDGRPEQC